MLNSINFLSINIHDIFKYIITNSKVILQIQ